MLMVSTFDTPCSCMSSPQSPLYFVSAFGENSIRSLAAPLSHRTRYAGLRREPCWGITMHYLIFSSFARSFMLMVSTFDTPCSCMVMP